MIGHTFRSLRHRNYALYFSGQLVSFTGSWMQSAALMWLVYELTSDPLWPPLMLVAAVGPTLFLGPLGGALADHYPKKRLVFATQAAFLIGAAALAISVASDSVNPIVLLAIQFVNGIVQSVDLPARLAFVPELVPKEDLINAIGLNSLTFNAARALGPAVAGGFFFAAKAAVERNHWHGSAALLGTIACCTLNALSYVAVLTALAFIRTRHLFTAPRIRGRFWDGLRFLRKKTGLFALILLTGMLSIFGWPLLTLLPAYTKSVLGLEERAYSFLVSALGAGALVGSIVTASYGTPERRERCLIIGVLGSLLGLLGLILTTTILAAVPSCMLFGFGLVLYLSTGQSTMQLRSPDSARGKVMALWAMTLSGSSIPGHLLAGRAAQVYPLTSVLWAMEIGVVVAAVGIMALALSGKLKA